jgi:translation initiation factor IF-2
MATGDYLKGLEKEMPKVRVYEIARQMGISNKELVSKIQGLGIMVNNHMSTLEVEDVQRVKRALDKERQENLVEERIGTTVIRRRSKVRRVAVKAEPEPAAPPAEAVPMPAVADRSAQAEHRPAETPGGSLGAEPLTGEAQPSAPAGTETAAAAKAGVRKTADAARAESAGQPEDVVAQQPGGASVQADGADPSAAATAAEPAAGEQPADAGPAAAAGPAPAQKEEKEKLGPTGRRIELSQIRPPTPQVVVTDLGEARRGHRRQEYTPWADRRGHRFGQKAQKGKRKAAAKKAKQAVITTPAEHKRRIRMEDVISVTELAKQMGIKAGEALKKLWAMGMTGININASLDMDTAGVLASEFGFEVENVAFQEEELIKAAEDAPEDLQTRSPVVTIMGHVDHGKTSLLDRIRKSDIVASEAGGITQHIGAYKAKTAAGEIVFIDTPGHEAFTAMRARGAQCTDLVILVVAADDGVMPQTREAIQHAQDANVPIVVAINKIDKADAEPEKVRQELTNFGLVPEEWGGDTIITHVSAVTGEGLDQLLEMVLLQAEMAELKANPEKTARGVVLEAMLDKSRGPLSTFLIQEGTLRVGDMVVAGESFGKVRALIDDRGRSVKTAGPSTPVRILGLDGVPDSGEDFYQLPDEKAARRIIDHRRDEKRKRELAESSASALKLDRIAELISEGTQKELKVVLKTDVQGSVEAAREALFKLATEKVKVTVVLSGVGGITESDVTFAKASGAVVVGFNVRPAGKAAQLSEHEGVEIRIYNVIYELLDDIKEVMKGLLPKERREKQVGQLEVRQTFNIPKVGTVAGCYVTEGKVTRTSMVRLYRDDIRVYEGRVGSLRRFKDDAKEVEKGYECGLSIENYNDVKAGDILEIYEIEEIAPEL